MLLQMGLGWFTHRRRRSVAEFVDDDGEATAGWLSQDARGTTLGHDSAHENIESIAGRLELLSEELNDLAMSLVSEAIAEGKGERPETEKRISRARRTVDRAVAQLRGSLTND